MTIGIAGTNQFVDRSAARLRHHRVTTPVLGVDVIAAQPKPGDCWYSKLCPSQYRRGDADWCGMIIESRFEILLHWVLPFVRFVRRKGSSDGNHAPGGDSATAGSLGNTQTCGGDLHRLHLYSAGYQADTGRATNTTEPHMGRNTNSRSVPGADDEAPSVGDLSLIMRLVVSASVANPGAMLGAIRALCCGSPYPATCFGTTAPPERAHSRAPADLDLDSRRSSWL